MAGLRGDRVKELAGRWIWFTARGHHNVRATHKSTIEITRESTLTPRGDCIVGVESQLSAATLPEWFKEQARLVNSLIVVILCSNGICDAVVGRGSPELIFSDSVKMIMRRSDYIEPATVMIKANKAAKDLRRDLIKALSEGRQLEVFATTIPMMGAYSGGG